MGGRERDRLLQQWEINARDLHRRMILAPTPRERERWSCRKVTSCVFASRMFNTYPQAGNPISLPGSGSKFRLGSQVAYHIR